MEIFDTYSLGLLIDRVHSTIVLLINKMLIDRGLDLTYSQFMILKRVFKPDGFTQKELTCQMRKDPAAVNRSIKRLIEKGYLRKGISPRDKNKLFLTPKGLESRTIIDNIINQIVDESLKGISEPNRKCLINMLLKIYKNIGTSVNS